MSIVQPNSLFKKDNDKHRTVYLVEFAEGDLQL